MKRKLSAKTILVAVLVGLLVVAASYFALAQSQPEPSRQSIQSGDSDRQPLIENQLRDLLTGIGVLVTPGFQMAADRNVREVAIRWETASASKTALATEQTGGKFSVSSSQVSISSLPRRRAVELAETEIFVAAVDANSKLVWWQVMSDPRVLRSEKVSSSGEVSGQTLYLPNVDFSISFPDEPNITEVRFFHPQWNGERFQLTQIGVITVR